jgi:hypothetical protein
VQVVSEYDWQLFQFTIVRPTLYVLGAGASLPIIGGDLASQIRRAVWNNGSYPAVPEPPSALKQWLLPYDIQHEIDAVRTDSISQNELDRLTPNALVEVLFARRLTLPSVVRTPQYAVFDCFAPSVLLNFNNDNLAEAIHRKHLCLRPHGSIDAQLVHSTVATDAIRWLAIPESWIEQLRYHRPLPEPSGITNQEAYKLLPRCFDALHAVVIIGYSFGEQRQSGLIHDTESFELLVDLLRWRPKPVLVIGPDPDSVAARVEVGTRRRVSTLACKWNVLSQFILVGAFARACDRSSGRDARAITSKYQAFEERVEYIATAAEIRF